MGPILFKAAIADIERYLGTGEAYTLDICTMSGRNIQGFAWQYIDTCPLSESGMIRLDKDDHPPIYMPIISIEHFQLSS